MAKKKAKKKLPVKGKSVLATSDETLGKPIRISCKGNESLPVDELTPMQGKLKTLSDEAYQKLRASILELGFSFPIFVWKFKGKNHILDGHQRRLCLIRMRDEEGFQIPLIPVISVEASTRKEAAKKLLAAASQFGKVEPTGLFNFMKEFEIEMPDLASSFQFPEINLESFRLAFFPATQKVEFNAKAEYAGMPEYENEDKTPFRQIIVSFPDEQSVEAFFEKIKQSYTPDTKSVWFPEQERNKTINKSYE
jgi:hypothetical protein